MGRLKVIALGFLAALSAGCLSVATPHPTSMNFDATSMEVVGPVEGEVEVAAALWLIPIQIDTYTSGEAIKRALAGRGDAIINAVYDEEFSFGLFGLIQKRVLRVNGIAIRFKKSARAAGTPTEPTLQAPPIQPNQKGGNAADFPTYRDADGNLHIGK